MTGPDLGQGHHLDEAVATGIAAALRATDAEVTSVAEATPAAVGPFITSTPAAGPRAKLRLNSRDACAWRSDSTNGCITYMRTVAPRCRIA